MYNILCNVRERERERDLCAPVDVTIVTCALCNTTDICL